MPLQVGIGIIVALVVVLVVLRKRRTAGSK
jgi:hypothetical protein